MREAPIVSLAGTLGTNVSCFFFRDTVCAIGPGGAKLPIRVSLDTIELQTFDGEWAIVAIKTIRHQNALLRVHQSYLRHFALATPKGIAQPEPVPNSNKRTPLWPVVELLLMGAGVALLYVATKKQSTSSPSDAKGMKSP